MALRQVKDPTPPIHPVAFSSCAGCLQFCFTWLGVFLKWGAFTFGGACQGLVISGQLSLSGAGGGGRWGVCAGLWHCLAIPVQACIPLLGFAHLGVGSCHALAGAPGSWPNRKVLSSPFPSQAMSPGYSSPTGQTLSDACSVKTWPAHTQPPGVPLSCSEPCVTEQPRHLAVCSLPCAVVFISRCFANLFSGLSHVHSLPPSVKTQVVKGRHCICRVWLYGTFYVP